MATAPLTIPTSPTAPLARHPTAVRPHEHARLVLATRDGRETTYVMTKSSIVLGRDSGCDLVLPRREVSRTHARLTATDEGAVMLESLGREPVCVNGQPVTAPVALSDGDVIEIALEGRSKVIRFVQPRSAATTADETVAIIAKGAVQRRAPLGDANAQRVAAAPPPPPPPPPPRAAASRPPPPPPPPWRAAAAAPARPAFSPGEVARAAVALAARRAAGGVAPPATRVAGARPPPPPPPARRLPPQQQQQTTGGLFIPCASELAARRAGLRKVTRGGGRVGGRQCVPGQRYH